MEHGTKKNRKAKLLFWVRVAITLWMVCLILWYIQQEEWVKLLKIFLYCAIWWFIGYIEIVEALQWEWQKIKERPK